MKATPSVVAVGMPAGVRGLHSGGGRAARVSPQGRMSRRQIT